MKKWIKGFCRVLTFMLTAAYTALLVKNVEGSAFVYIPIIFLLGACAWYGWSDIDK